MDFTNTPDLFPITAALCATLSDKSILNGIARLQFKESNRVEAMQRLLTQMRIECGYDNNSFWVVGGKSKGTIVDSKDHRIVMSATVFGLIADGKMQFKHPECVAKSFPKFWKIYEQNILIKELLSNHGPMAEQFVAQECFSYTIKNETPALHYWHCKAKSGSAEVDFLTEHEFSILPIEVKSRQSNKIKSLKISMQEKNTFVKQGLKISEENFGKQNNILSLPFYAVGKIFDGSPPDFSK